MYKNFFIVFSCIVLFSGCIIEQVDAPCRVANGNTAAGTYDKNSVGIANPASQYCTDMGYKNEIRKNSLGEYGACIFPDSSECDEWKFFRGECGQVFSRNTVIKKDTGTVEGSLSYPSEGMPEDLKVCARNMGSDEKFCTGEHILDKKYSYGVGYRISLPAGKYTVYAETKEYKDYKAYYTDFIVCGQNAENCTSHKATMVEVKAGDIKSNIDPGDWYIPKTT